MSRASEAVRQASRSSDPVLIVAERGFSPERIARSIHGESDRPFISLDCASAPADTLIRNLFGHVASRRTDLETVARRSLVARARGGTLLVTSVGELPTAAQLRLSRLLRDGELRLGSSTVPLNVRVIGAATPGLERDVADNRFRRELFERLQRIRIDVPPLRARQGDLPRIIETVLHEVCAARTIERSLTPAALTALAALPWGGNLEEVRFVLDRLVTNVASNPIRQEDVLADLRPAPEVRRFTVLGTLRDARLSFEREYIAAVLQDRGWRMSEAAQALGIERANLYRKIRQLGITRVKPRRVS